MLRLLLMLTAALSKEVPAPSKLSIFELVKRLRQYGLHCKGYGFAGYE